MRYHFFYRSPLGQWNKKPFRAGRLEFCCAEQYSKTLTRVREYLKTPDAAPTALSIYHGQAHGNLTEEVMAGLNCPLDSADLAIEHALSISYEFGGHNALLLLKKHRS
jgi:hypothetical protein